MIIQYTIPLSRDRYVGIVRLEEERRIIFSIASQLWLTPMHNRYTPNKQINYQDVLRRGRTSAYWVFIIKKMDSNLRTPFWPFSTCVGFIIYVFWGEEVERREFFLFLTNGSMLQLKSALGDNPYTPIEKSKKCDDDLYTLLNKSRMRCMFHVLVVALAAQC